MEKVSDDIAPCGILPLWSCQLVPIVMVLLLFKTLPLGVNTAEKIYDNIEKGVYDVSNEAHGIKVGVTATNSARYMQKDGNGSGGKGGCC